MQDFIHLLQQQFTLKEKTITQLLDAWNKKVELKRGDFLIQEGQIERYLYWVKGGTQRIFYTTEEGVELCVGFGYENTLLCSYPSFLYDEPSEYAIQTLSKTTLVGISRDIFMHLVETCPDLERCWRISLEEALMGRIRREIDLLTTSPKLRVERLLKRSPHIFQYIPNKYLASYLRMTPETLSRCLKS